MKTIQFIIIIVLSIFLHSCSENSFTQVVEIDIPDHEEKLAFSMNIAEGDTLLSTFVSKSLEINADEVFPNFDNAKVQLFKDGEFFKDLVFNPSNENYEIAIEPLINEQSTFTIEVEVPGFDKASASQRMPKDVEIKNLELEFDAGIDDYGDRIDVLSFNISDEAGKENYYGFEIFTFKIYEFDEEDVFIDHLYLYSNDPLIEEGRDGNGLLSDNAFEGGEYQVRLNIDKWQLNLDGVKELVILARITSLSKDNYLFQKSLGQFYNADGNPFAEPVTVHNNIENGYGIFTCASKIEEQIRVK